MHKNIQYVPIRTEQTADRIIDGEAVIVEPAAGMVNVLNMVGTRIWELIDGARTIGEIAEIIAGEFDADPEIILNETIQFIEALRQKNWLKYRHES